MIIRFLKIIVAPLIFIIYFILLPLAIFEFIVIGTDNILMFYFNSIKKIYDN